MKTIELSRNGIYAGLYFAIVDDEDYEMLGRYKNEIDAAKAYNEAALKYFGEFARINEF